MPLYFKIDPSDDSIIDVLQTNSTLENYNTKTTAALNGKPYLVAVIVTDPAFDSATQVKEGPVDSYDGTTATRTYTVRAKTQAELDADQRQADISKVRNGVLKLANSYTLLARVLVDKAIIDPLVDFDQSARDDFLEIEAAVNRLENR